MILEEGGFGDDGTWNVVWTIERHKLVMGMVFVG